MDKLQYAILGWIDEGQPADPEKLSAMLGLSLSSTERRVQILRIAGAITARWEARFQHQILCAQISEPLCPKGETP